MSAPWSEQAQTYRTHLDRYLRTGDATVIGDASRRLFRLWQHSTPGASRISELHHEAMRQLVNGKIPGANVSWDTFERGGTFLNGILTSLDALHENSTEIAHRDRLTGLPNHRTLFEDLSSEAARSLRHTRPLSVAVVVIAGLDRLEGSRADGAVYRVAWSLGRAMRREDRLYRSGRDEFVVMLPDTGEEGAASAARRLAESIETGIQGDEFLEPVELITGVAAATMPCDATDAPLLIDEARSRAYQHLGDRRARSPLTIDPVAAVTRPPFEGI